ncbi:MAG TPA: hypothetical protein DCM14_02180 [Clostridiales bacterium UBA8153]|nr:hypothetical protein [Clostridiales bacterium UBA8153]
MDTLLATAEAFRFFGRPAISPSVRAEERAGQPAAGISQVLQSVLSRGSLVSSRDDGSLGSPQAGA